MGVLLTDAPMGGPARVSDPGCRSGAVRPRDLLELAQVADRADIVRPCAFEQADSRRVVAPVLESLQALQQEVSCTTRSDVPDDPAHSAFPFRRSDPSP